MTDFNNTLLDIAAKIVSLEKRIELLEAQSFTARLGWGNWTPTSPGASWTNITALSLVECSYYQLTNAVTCWGAVGIQWTSAGALVNTEFDLTLPVAANFTAARDCVGFFFRYNIDYAQQFGPGQVTGDVATDNAHFRFLVDGVAGSTITFYFHFSYLLE